jgi:hypothetical protein
MSAKRFIRRLRRGELGLTGAYTGDRLYTGTVKM